MIPRFGRSPGAGHNKPLQYYCLENPHEQRSLVGYSPWGCKELDMTELTKHSTGMNQETKSQKWRATTLILTWRKSRSRPVYKSGVLAHLHPRFASVISEIICHFLHFFFLLNGYFKFAIFCNDSQSLKDHFIGENPQVWVVVWGKALSFSVHFIFSWQRKVNLGKWRTIKRKFKNNNFHSPCLEYFKYTNK